MRIIANVDPMFSSAETRILEEILSGEPTSLVSISQRLEKNPHTVKTQLSHMRLKYRDVTGHPDEEPLEMNVFIAGLIFWGKIQLK